MSLLCRLFRRLRSAEKAIEEADKQIEEKTKNIEAMDNGIQATQPFVDEAIKRTDDGYYKMRSKAGVASRRLGRETEHAEELLMLERLTKDMDTGWRR